MMSRSNSVKRALAEGRVQIGTWIHVLGHPSVPQVIATAGFDFVHVDMEHSPFSTDTVGHLCAAAYGAGLMPFVRPPTREAHHIGRALDSGAMGVLVAHIDTPEEADAVVRAAKFPPRGLRGSQPPSPHMGYGKANAGEANPAQDRESLVLVQIESARAVENVDAILAVDGVDGASVGRGDLSAALGVAGQRNHPDVLAGVHAMIAGARRHGKTPALLLNDLSEADEWIAAGVRLLTYGGDAIFLRTAAEAAATHLRASAAAAGLVG